MCKRAKSFKAVICTEGEACAKDVELLGHPYLVSFAWWFLLWETWMLSGLQLLFIALGSILSCTR